jgi:hypothetical protein
MMKFIWKFIWKFMDFDELVRLRHFSAAADASATVKVQTDSLPEYCHNENPERDVPQLAYYCDKLEN